MNNDTLKLYKEVIYADKVFDVNFKNVSMTLYEEIERLNNIIKEVREYIQDDIKGNYFKRYDDEAYEMCEKLLKILDEGGLR